MSLGKTLPRDANYDASTAPMDDDIEHMIFPSLDKGQPMYDMAVAERLEKELIDSKVTKPVLPKAVWDVSCALLSMYLMFLLLIFSYTIPAGSKCRGANT